MDKSKISTKYTLIFSDVAIKHFAVHDKAGNPATIKRIDRILEELVLTPYAGIGHPHALGYDYAGCWSRHINKKDVMVYEVFEDTMQIHIHTALGHYLDK